MDKKVLRLEKCQKCGWESHYLVRGDNVNSKMKDKDIRVMMSSNVKEPFKLRECPECGLDTLHMVVGWKGTKEAQFD